MAAIVPYSYQGAAPGGIQQQSMFQAPKLQVRGSTPTMPQGDLRRYGRTGSPPAMQGQHQFFQPPASVQPVASAAPVAMAPAAPDPMMQGVTMFANAMGKANRADDGIRIEGEVDFATKARDAINQLFGKAPDPTKSSRAVGAESLKQAMAEPVPMQPMDVSAPRPPDQSMMAMPAAPAAPQVAAAPAVAGPRPKRENYVDFQRRINNRPGANDRMRASMFAK